MNDKVIIVSKKPKKCPVCSFKPIAKIIYGEPCLTLDEWKKVEEGKIAIGTCTITGDDPKWQCTNCDTKFKIALIKSV